MELTLAQLQEMGSSGFPGLLGIEFEEAGDRSVRARLALVPQLTGARTRGKKHWLPHLALGAFEVGMAAFTKTEPPRPVERRAEAVKKLAKNALKAKVVKDVTQVVAKTIP